MRLTLRTLLAYLDDCLEPSDAQDIGKKIEESEFAANIVHRTRDVMRRLRLGAPRLSGRGMGLDANTVAEYLDNSLADDRVADFEKVCLESDVHLAEVGSCHQIIALALREAADVDTPLRERMYALPETAAATKTEEEPAAKPEPAKNKQPAAPVRQPAAEPVVSQRRKAEVPEYLRQPEETRSWLRPAAAVALAGMLIVVLIMAIDGSWLADKLGLGPNRGTPGPVAEGQNGTPTPEPEPEEKPENGAPAATPSEATPPETELQQPESIRVSTKPQEPPEPTTTTTPRETPENKPETPAAPAATTEKPVEPINKAVPAAATNTPTKPEPKETPANPPPAAPVANGTVGRMIAGNQVLLRADLETASWQRVPAQEMIAAGQRLISLPGFRPTITLTNGITLELLGGTSAELQPAGEDGTPGVHLEYGRIVALTPAKPDVGLKVTVGSRRIRVVFGDNGAKMALESMPIHAKGSNPETERPQLMAAMYVAAGKLTLIEGEQSQEVQSPSLVSLGNAEAPGNDLPDWISVDKLPQSERIGAEFISDSLTLERPILGLKELADHRRVEVRTLAVQGLARVGEFEPLVAALNQTDPNFKTIWSDLIHDLRDAIARGPETAARVREAFERQRGERAEALYRMLWAYSIADLKANDSKALKELVGYLDHNDMDFRALAFWNLRDLTGATGLYLPSQTAEQRKRYVQNWKQRLESGLILPKVE